MATAAETAAHGGAEASAGMPQLDFSTFPNQIFWLVVTLVALYFLLSRIALPRIAGILADRHEAIASDLEAAASLKEKVAAAETAYQKALSDARAEANAIAAKARADIQADLDAAVAKADAEIAARAAESERRIAEVRANAVASVSTVANDTAAEIVKALLPGATDDAAVARAVAALMKG
jgi:F-type H+-transporting ATPase subunit b